MTSCKRRTKFWKLNKSTSSFKEWWASFPIKTTNGKNIVSKPNHSFQREFFVKNLFYYSGLLDQRFPWLSLGKDSEFDDLFGFTSSIFTFLYFLVFAWPFFQLVVVHLKHLFWLLSFRNEIILQLQPIQFENFSIKKTLQIRIKPWQKLWNLVWKATLYLCELYLSGHENHVQRK